MSDTLTKERPRASGKTCVGFGGVDVPCRATNCNLSQSFARIFVRDVAVVRREKRNVGRWHEGRSPRGPASGREQFFLVTGLQSVHTPSLEFTWILFAESAAFRQCSWNKSPRDCNGGQPLIP